MLVKHNLEPNASEYIEDVLSFDSVLCRCLRKVFKSESRKMGIYAFFPKDLDVKNVVEYNKGGIYEKASSYLPRYLLDKYGHTKGAVFLLDDVMSSPSDDYLPHEESTVFSIGSDVYHFCAGDLIGEASLEKLIWACGVSWHFICVVLKEESSKLVAEGMTESILCKSIQDGFLEMVIGAFDGEGYIHCSVVG